MSTLFILTVPTTRRTTAAHRLPRPCRTEPARCPAAAPTPSARGTSAAATTAASTPAWSLCSHLQFWTGWFSPNPAGWEETGGFWMAQRKSYKLRPAAPLRMEMSLCIAPQGMSAISSTPATQLKESLTGASASSSVEIQMDAT